MLSGKLHYVSSKDLDSKARFLCPHCQSVIDPEGVSSNYTIENIMVDVMHGTMVVIIHCNCGSILFLELKIPEVEVYTETFEICYVSQRKEL